jgi:hypothetical protein
LHLALVCALALGTVVLPSLSRCVDASGHDEIELSNADCCAGAPANAGIEPAGACIGGCVDGRLIVPSLSRTPDAKHAVKAPLPAAAFSFSLFPAAASRVSRAPARPFGDAIGSRALLARSTSVLLC